MHCEIIDRNFNIFFVEIQLKKENLKSAFWAPEIVCPKWYTGLPNDLNTSLIIIITITIISILIIIRVNIIIITITFNGIKSSI